MRNWSNRERNKTGTNFLKVGGSESDRADDVRLLESAMHEAFV